MGRLQIIDESTLCSSRRWRRARAAALLAAGAALGWWLGQPDTTAGFAPVFASTPPAPTAAAPAWCDEARGLRLSCSLQTLR